MPVKVADTVIKAGDVLIAKNGNAVTITLTYNMPPSTDKHVWKLNKKGNAIRRVR